MVARPWRSQALATVAVLLAGGTNPTFAEPKSLLPPSVWSLTSRSEIVAIGTIREVIRPPDSHSTAWLDVEEFLKGGGDASIAVKFDPTVLCPQPPRFEAGARVIVFLRSIAAGLTTLDHGDGVRTISSGDQLASYRRLILGALAAANRDDAERERLRREWSVEAVVDPDTRREGVNEIDDPPARLDSSMLRKEGRPNPRPTAVEQLSATQLDRVVDALIRSTGIGDDWIAAASLLDHFPSHAFDANLTDRIDCALREATPPKWLRWLMSILLSRRGVFDVATWSGPRQDRDATYHREFLRAVWIHIEQTGLIRPTDSALDHPSLR